MFYRYFTCKENHGGFVKSSAIGDKIIDKTINDVQNLKSKNVHVIEEM